MTRLTKTLSYEHKAKKNQVGEKDISDKFKVIAILKKYFSINAVTGETIFIPDSKPVQYHRMPDLFIKEKNTAIELDGEIHGNGDEVTKRDKDKDRDTDYQKAGVKLIILNKETTHNYNELDVVQIFREAFR